MSEEINRCEQDITSVGSSICSASYEFLTLMEAIPPYDSLHREIMIQIVYKKIRRTHQR